MCSMRILKTEEALITQRFHNLSVKEMHVIETVCLAEKGEDGDMCSTTIASNLRILAGTLTTAVSLLEKKGYLGRQRSDVDRRVVFYPNHRGGANCEQISRKIPCIDGGRYHENPHRGRDGDSHPRTRQCQPIL